PVALFCGGGTRSRIGVSVLRRAGFTQLLDQGGGFPAHAEAGLPVEGEGGCALAPPRRLRDSPLPFSPSRRLPSHRRAIPARAAPPAVLRGEVGADLSPSARTQLETLAHDAQTEKRLTWMRDELGGRLKQPDASWGVYYLLSAVCALNGEVERA